MELNTRGRYAVMAMTDIAQRVSFVPGDSVGGTRLDDVAVPLSSIADSQQISLAYLEQLFVKLRRAGLVESARGRSGGYRLSRPAASISVADILAAVDEGVRMTRCHGEDASPCVSGQRCITHGLWEALGENIQDFLSGVSLQQVADGGPGKLPRITDMVPPSVLFNGGVAPR